VTEQRPRFQWRLVLFLLSAVAIFAAAYILYATLNTLQRLDVVEAERDTWQRPDEVIRAMNVHAGNVVVDLGSGAGYFTLKLSRAVGERGQVLAVDIRKLSLSFLWIRSAFRAPHNIRIIVGDQDNAHLPGSVDAILIANTYHEFENPGIMLRQCFRSLHPGGRLVIVDRAPVAGHHEVAVDVVEQELGRRGFEVMEKQDHFIERPDGDVWWLISARIGRIMP